jgi:hypothetical protein
LSQKLTSEFFFLNLIPMEGKMKFNEIPIIVSMSWTILTRTQ